MICKKCNNNISNGTFCLRCGTENAEEEVIEEKEVTVKKRKNTILHVAIVIAIIWLITLIVLGITKNCMKASYDACVAETGHTECGLGKLCDSKCNPPFYVTISVVSTTLHVISIKAFPGFLVLAFILNYLSKKKKE